MLYDLLENYFKPNEVPRHTPLAVDALTAGDYHLYLYDGGKAGWFVVVEADHLFVTEIPADIEASFPVDVEGWYTLKAYREQAGQKLLPRDLFKSERVDETDEDWEHYHGVACESHNMNYALLGVRPKQGVTVRDFGLTYYGEN